MNILDIANAPVQALDYMDRLINDGPPSKMFFANNVSLQYNPLLVDQVNVDIVSFFDTPPKKYGEEPEIISKTLGENGLFIHPDFHARAGAILGEDCFKISCEGVPTSSSRTIRLPQLQCYIKLHYPATLGRVSKALSRQDILNSIDVTNALYHAIRRGVVSPLLGFFPEVSGRGATIGDSEFTFTVRKSCAEAQRAEYIKYIVPAFSLYGKDYKKPHDPTLLAQLISNRIGVGCAYVEKLLIPVVDCYLSLLFLEGLQHEMHSQNFLLGFDGKWELQAIILRDLESIQKDLTIRSDNRIKERIESYPSRCLWRGQENYEVKHSFMYDHKLFEFFIKPLVEKTEKNNIERCTEVYREIQGFVRNKYSAQINEYFPKDGMWYKFDDVIVAQGIKRRLFLQCPHPAIR